MKKRAAFLVLASALALGALAARGADTRTVKVEKAEALALVELTRRGQELEDVKKRWLEAKAALDADTAEVMSGLRLRYGIAPGEEVVSFDQQKGLLTVSAAKAPAAPGK